MPNWCTNNFSIQGPTAKIKALFDNVKQVDGGLLNAMVPIGEWEYAKAIDAWGTKWDVESQGIEFTDNSDGTASIYGWFESAWSPPLTAFQNFCEENQDVSAEISYFEPGMCFTGRWNSAEAIDEYYEIDPDDMSNIPAELLEEFDIENWFLFDEETA